MKNKTKWFDPICYQFSFYLLGKKDEAWNPVEATKPFFEELIPYYNLWIALQGTVMLAAQPPLGNGLELLRIPRCFTTSTTNLSSNHMHSIVSKLPLCRIKHSLSLQYQSKPFPRSGDKKFCSIQTWMIPSLWVRLKRQRGYVKCSTVQQMILKGSVFHKNASSQREYR